METGSAPSTGHGLLGQRTQEATKLTVEAVLWPTGSAAEAVSPRFSCLVFVDGAELGRATNFPFGPLSLPSGRHDSRLALRFVSGPDSEEDDFQAYIGEVSMPLAKLHRPGSPRSSSTWLGLPPCRPGTTSLDLQQAIQNVQNPEVPKASISVAWPSLSELAPILEGQAPQEAEAHPDSTAGPACGSGRWARSAAPLLWRYEPGDGIAIKIRSSPVIDSGWQGNTVNPGEAFEVCQEVVSDGGIRFLKLCDGRGWLFDIKPGIGTMCVRQEQGPPAVADSDQQQGASEAQTPQFPAPGLLSAKPTPRGRPASYREFSASESTMPPMPIPSGPCVRGPPHGVAFTQIPEGDEEDRLAANRRQHQALCQTGWVRNRRSLSPVLRHRDQSPRASRGQALCHSPDFLRNAMRTGSKSVSVSSTQQHGCVPVVKDVNSPAEVQEADHLQNTRGEVARSQSVVVPSRKGEPSEPPPTHLNDPVPTVSDLAAPQELATLKSELSAARAAEMREVFMRQDMQDQLRSLRAELDASRQASSEVKAQDEKHRRELWAALEEAREASAEIRTSEGHQRQELLAALEEAREAGQLRETQLYLEEEVLGMSVELDTLRGSERKLQEDLDRACGELDQLRRARKAQEMLQDDAMKASREVEALQQRELELLAQLKDACPPSEIVLLRQQLDEANSMAEQGVLMQDEFAGLSVQLENACAHEMQLEEQLQQANTEVGKLRSSYAKQAHLEEEVVGLGAVVNAFKQKERQQEAELLNIRAELVESKQEREELRIRLAQPQSQCIIAPEDKIGQPLDMTMQMQVVAPSTPTADETDGKTLEDELRGIADEVALRKERRCPDQLHLVAQAAQFRQRSLQEMLQSSQPQQDAQHRDELLRACAELKEMRQEEQRLEHELQGLRSTLEASLEAQARQTALLRNARLEADEARAEQKRQQQLLEDEVAKAKAARWSTGSPAETGTTCSSEGSKDLEESMQAALDALHNSEQQRQELQTQAARQAAELATLRAKDLQREERLASLRKEMDVARQTSDHAVQTIQAKLACTELAKERMREHLLSELQEFRGAKEFASAQEDPQPSPAETRCGQVSDRQFVWVHNEWEEALRAKERLHQNMQDLEGELLQVRTQFSAEVLENQRSSAALCGELAAMRAELTEARGSDWSLHADGDGLQSTRLVRPNSGVPRAKLVDTPVEARSHRV